MKQEEAKPLPESASSGPPVKFVLKAPAMPGADAPSEKVLDKDLQSLMLRIVRGAVESRSARAPDTRPSLAHATVAGDALS